MCSIMGFSKKTRSREEILPYFARTRSRGPDMSRIVETPSGYLCFHRLAIMDLSEDGMQPFSLDGDYVVCNGELYGFRSIRRELAGLHPVLQQAAKFAPGIRILRQDPWEALCSFIISQKKRTHRKCTRFLDRFQ